MSSPARARTGAPGVDVPSPGRAARIAVALPDRLAIGSIGLVLAVAICVQTGLFHPYTVVPLAIALIAAGWRLVPRSVPATRAQVIGALAVLAIAVLWIGVNAPFTSELISVRRDPSIYTLRGLHLMQFSSPDWTVPSQLVDIKRQIRSVVLDFGETPRPVRYFQSTTIVPGLIAIGGWIGGPGLLFRADLIIGAGALIATYSIARRLAGPVYGLLPVLALAIGMPLAAFSRVAYTEPLSLLLAMVGLLGLWTAWRENRWALWVLAGLGIGGVSLCRIDGALALIGAFVGLGVLAGFAGPPGRRKARNGVIWFTVGAAPMFVLGFTDLKFHSPDYLYSLRGQAYPLWIVTGAAAVTALLLGYLPLAAAGRWLWRRRVGLSAIAVGAIAVALVVMIARPLFWTGRFSAGVYAGAVAARQGAEGLAIDPTRSYDEQSVRWLAWYFGWPLVIGAGAAVVAAGWWMVRRRDGALLLVLAVPAVNAVLYLNYINITPDQIWAMRRFLPIIVPGMLLAAAWGAARLHARLARPLAGSPAASARFRLILPALVAATLVFPLVSWRGLFGVREGAGQYAMVTAACDRFAPDRKVLLLGTIPDMGYYQPTFRELCGAQVIYLNGADGKGAVRPVPAATIARIARLWGGTVTVATFKPDQIPWSTPPAGPVAADTYQMWQSVLSHRPTAANVETGAIYLGTVLPNGLVRPTPP